MEITQNFRTSVPALMLAMISLASCSSEEMRDEPIPASKETVKLQFKLGPNTYTKADDENEVENLFLAFYNSNNGSPTFLQIEEASPEGGNSYSVELNVIPPQIPDMVVAFVNIKDKNAIKNALDATNPSTINSILSENNNLVMSNTRYFDSNDKDIYFTTFDYTSQDAIALDVERVASKVTVSKASDFKSSYKKLKDKDGNQISLNLTLSGWGTTATDNASYLIRQVDSFDLESTFPNLNWKDTQNKMLHWAKSINYDFDFSNTPANVNYATASDITTQFDNEIYVHESTRPVQNSYALNSRPSIVLKGFYIKEGKDTPETFYRYKFTIFSEEELYEFLLNRISNKIKISGHNTLTVSDLKDNFELVNLKSLNGKQLPLSYFTLNLKENAEINNFTDSSDKKFDNIESLNKYLAEICSVVEKFDNGNCFFVIPIEHHKYNNTYLYGLVRNHFYKISINEIDGLGSGLPDEEVIIEEQPPFDETDSYYNISFTLNIRDWNEISQDV
ncbi:MAG: fimbria major subunit, partial [Muribaculaceae bacterium]|nr:fimbria major subunit [Muribaculaceae bacterium]